MTSTKIISFILLVLGVLLVLYANTPAGDKTDKEAIEIQIIAK